MRVNRLAYAVFDTADLDRQLDHYTRVVGLTLIERDGEAAYLSAGFDHHTIVLRKGSAAGCVALGFQIAPAADLSAFARGLEAHGVDTKRLSDNQPGIRDLVAFTDLKGTRIEVFGEYATVANGYQRTGIVPSKLGHVAHTATDVQGNVQFYCEVLGFRVSDWIGDFFAFLRCGADHHTVNMATGKTNKMHHIALELRDWGHIKEACDLLASERIPLVWGPVRHGVGHNISVYYRNPDRPTTRSAPASPVRSTRIFRRGPRCGPTSRSL
jgi:catechol 2,3-dioxygenase-like lactoylglutathione lyase family enzyme